MSRKSNNMNGASGSLVARSLRVNLARSGSKGANNTTFSKGGTPNQARMVLVYTVNKTISAAAGVCQDQVFSGNGVFDPDITAAGAQCANYDDWSALYSRYRVYGSRITIYPLAQGASGGAGVFFIAIAARHTTTAVTSTSAFDSAVAQPFTDLISVGSSAGGGAPGGKFSIEPYTSAYTTAQFLGYNEVAIRTDDTLQALTSANPVHQWYWHVIVRVADDTSTGDGRFYCKIEYDVEFFDRTDTLLDLNTNIYSNLVRLLNRYTREEKKSNDQRLRLKSESLRSLLLEYKDQIMDPNVLEESGPEGRPSVGRSVVVDNSTSTSGLEKPVLRRLRG